MVGIVRRMSAHGRNMGYQAEHLRECRDSAGMERLRYALRAWYGEFSLGQPARHLSSNVTSVLNDLIETSKDGEKGFGLQRRTPRTRSCRRCFYDAPKTAPRAQPISSNSSLSTAVTQRREALSRAPHTAVGST